MRSDLDLVCPECGNTELTAVLTTRTRYTYMVGQSSGLTEVSESVEDSGDLSGVDNFECTDCGDLYARPEEQWIIREQYDTGRPAVEFHLFDRED